MPSLGLLVEALLGQASAASRRRDFGAAEQLTADAAALLPLSRCLPTQHARAALAAARAARNTVMSDSSGSDQALQEVCRGCGLQRRRLSLQFHLYITEKHVVALM
jgi:hypothetical protein